MNPNLTCACCGYKTIGREFEICYVCWWQKDSYQEEVNPDDDDGPNYVSLKVARENYKQFRACDRKFEKLAKSPATYDM
ncbi:CPCC family cysteine-rich protein [Hymenobacter koreensis]|uniref:CPCC family cysteine-rich protein n=1 Tax=Hymenobacter koreensis TaxID=1084523 RepID=A0ABP8J8Q3_9BACT